MALICIYLIMVILVIFHVHNDFLTVSRRASMCTNHLPIFVVLCWLLVVRILLKLWIQEFNQVLLFSNLFQSVDFFHFLKRLHKRQSFVLAQTNLLRFYVFACISLSCPRDLLYWKSYSLVTVLFVSWNFGT